MLLCDRAVLGAKKPQKIYCDITNGPCVHVRFCAVSMKYYQTDNAKNCLAKEADHGKNTQTGSDD